MRKEPSYLRRGKEFHRGIQADWSTSAEGDVQIERSVTKPNGRRGRVDILVDADSEIAAVVEAKASDWDRMTEAAVRRNVRRQVRQIWAYVESQLAEAKSVCPGVVFPKMPTSTERRELIERLFEEEGITVVWDDETIQQRKGRSD